MNYDLEMDTFLNKWKDLLSDIPTYLKLYIAALSLFLLFLVFWVPGNDFDSLSSYIARIKLEQFGNLRETATLEIQYTFPKFFDYLHKPFLKLGYFTTLPNFLLFLSIIGILIKFFPKKISLIAVSLVLLAEPIMINITGQKNDFALGAFAFLSWFCIAYSKNTKWYLSISFLTLCSLVGTKWHGFFLCAPLGVFLIYQLFTTHKPNVKGWLVFLLSTPVFYYVSSMSTYINNILSDGKLCPIPDYLSTQPINFKIFCVNIYRFISTNILDTFDIPNYFIDLLLTKGALFKLVNKICISGKYNYAYVVDSHVSAWGIILIISLLFNFYILINYKKFSREILFGAISAIFYTLCIILINGHGSGFNRYYIASYLLALIPFSQLLNQINFTNKLKIILPIWLIGATAHASFFNQEKALFNTYEAYIEAKPIIFYKATSFISAYKRGKRDMLYFTKCNGAYWAPFLFQKENIKQSDSLLFINCFKGNTCPPIWPFIKNRLPHNTYIINERYNQSVDLEKIKPKYIIAFIGQIENSNLIHKFENSNYICKFKQLSDATVHIYERTDNLILD